MGDPQALSARLNDTLAHMRQHARPDQLEGMARFGLVGDGRLGLSVPFMRQLARQLGPDQDLADQLWETAIPDARIVASMIAEPKRLGSRQMDYWAKGFAAWDVCDQTCLNVFRRSPLAWHKVPIWARRRDTFVRRAAFALLATLAVHDKSAPDARFIEALQWIEATAHDDRNFVKKAVNWALRAIGKRNPALRQEAIACAQRIRAQGSHSARWIAADALRELQPYAG